MKYRHEDLYWLIEPQSDFREQCKALDSQTGPIGHAIQRLASARLNNSQLVQLSSRIRQAQERGADLAPLSQFRLAVLGNSTTNLFASALPAAGARHGVNIVVHEAEYDQVMQEALNPASSTNASRPDAVLLALDSHGLPFDQDPFEYLLSVKDGFRSGCNAPLIFQTVVCPPLPLFGSLDAGIETTPRSRIVAFNDKLREFARESGDYVLDVAALAEMIGTQTWLDPAQWNLYKLPFAQNLVPVYVEHIARLVAAIRGRVRKCLILDLDNTLWGGVIGDDGLNGIKIGQGDAIGEAHLELQVAAKALQQRGIILAVSSKNDDLVARKPFEDHPDMVLRKEDFSVFQANWNDKASNLEAIAKELNLSLEAIVFVDDNPVERSQVRMALPMVAVPELPEDVSLYARTILNAGYFEAISFSEDDRKRADHYRGNSERTELKTKSRDIGEFLQSLEMKIETGAFNDFNLARVTQLINKTNQFNLTTRRYSQAEVEHMMRDPSVITLQTRLADRFGDNGLVSVSICRCENGGCDIDTWLMSCRVLGRRLEEAVFDELVTQCANRGVSEIRGRYRPTGKNGMVADHFKALGFQQLENDGEDTMWTFQVKDYKQPSLPFEKLEG